MEQLANENYYVNKLTRDEFVRLFAELKADVLKVQEGAAVFGTAEDMLHDESKISEINRILKTQFDAADMPKTKAATVRGLLELTKDFTNEIITKQQKYVEAGRLSRKVRTLWRTLDDLVDKQDSVSDIHKTFEKLSRNDQNAIQAKRREYERLLNEFRALNPPPPIGSNPTIDNHIREQKKFLTLFQRFLQRAGIRPTVPPSVRSIPTVAIFDPRFTPQYFAIDERIAGTFANEAFCLSDLPVFQRYEDLCAAVDQPSKLTLAQQTPYYYSNPSNPTSILLNHSAGSGKTAAMTLACSLFVRAGYLPIIVTTEALAADTTYEKAVFIECADWNIQQLLQSNGRRNLIELVEETTSKPTVEQVIHSGRRLYRKMATTTNDDIWDPSLKMKFKDFSHMCRSILMGYKPSGIHGKILADRAPFINGKQNFLWKTVILMDEVQTMMDELPPTEGTFNYETTPFGDIRNVILALWAARRDTYEGPVVIAASATPGNSEFELAMILNLLCTESEGYKFTNRPYYKGWQDPSDPQSFTYEKEKPRLIKAFKAAHPDPKKLLARMALGRVSYYDSSASKSVPPMRVVPVHVELTGDQQTTQAKMLQKLATEIRLEQRADGSWEIQRDYGSQFMRGQTDHRKNSESLRTFTAQVKGNSIIAQTASGNTILGKVRNNGYFVPPKVKGGPDSVIRTREDYAKWKEIAPIISPLYTRTIDCLQMNKIRGIRKQYVYINLDSKAPQGSDLFCKMLGSLLRYNEVDRPTDGNVYNGNYARVTTSNLSTMLDLFNSAENQNGAVIDIIVLDRSTKEGVSLFGVGAVYIVGVMDSETDLVQSVARAFRNCRTDPSELYPPLHDVPVMLMTPFANDSPVHSILAEVNNANVKNDLKPDQMAEILKTASFDRDILRRENDAAMVANKKLTEFLKM
jgi:hypothetical protein